MKEEAIVGYVVAYVDDVLFSAPTKYIEVVMKAFQEEWNGKSFYNN